MTTIVFPPGKFVCYLRQPKSASSSMTRWMVNFAQQNRKTYLTSMHYQQKNYNVDIEPETIFTHHMTADRVRAAVPLWWDQMEKIVTVRNPWNILASKYYHMKKLGITQVDCSNFTEFCYKLRELRGTLNPGKDYYSIDGEIIAEHIIPVENLEYHLKHIFQGYILPELEHVNVGTINQSQYKEIYSSDINDMIYEDFKYEIEKFGYKF